MPEQQWTTAARIDDRGDTGLRAILLVAFWLWGIGGLLFNGFALAALPSNVGVGTSAYLTATIVFWMGGMVLFGLGAIAITSDYEFKRLEVTNQTND